MCYSGKCMWEHQSGSHITLKYFLDVGNSGTFVIECHDFFSCGLYGFADYSKLPHMFYKTFKEIIKNN